MPIDILLLASTEMELQDIRPAIRRPADRTVAGKHRRRGVLSGRDVLLVQTGLGLVNTAHAVTCVLQEVRPSLVLQFGVGGAYPASGLDVGDIAVATEEIYGDLGVMTPEGWRPADMIGIPLLEKKRKYYNRFPADPALTADAMEIIRDIEWSAPPPNIGTGPFVTVQRCSGTTLAGHEMATRFDGLCENMEGAAAAHLCALYEVPFLEVRGISNRVADRNPAAWNLPLSNRRAQRAAGEIIKRLDAG